MLKRTSFFVIMLAFCLSPAYRASAQEKLPGKLVTAEWLSENLAGKDLRVIDVRADVELYWEGHIPGAVYLSPASLTLPEGGVPAKLVPPSVLAAMLGAMGIGETTRVVVYADGRSYDPSYLLWALDYLGHGEAGVLVGGVSLWKRKGYPLTKEYPRVDPVSYPLDPEGGLRREVLASLNEVETAMRGRSGSLLDDRSFPSYAGRTGPWQRRGHIPGAVNRYWRDDLAPDGTWKGASELRQAYSALGVTPGKTVITYGDTGRMGAHAYVTLKYVLGYSDVKNYDGGFNEWSAYGGLPVAEGGAPGGAQ